MNRAPWKRNACNLATMHRPRKWGSNQDQKRTGMEGKLLGWLRRRQSLPGFFPSD